jgi:hypothetical protein
MFRPFLTCLVGLAFLVSPSMAAAPPTNVSRETLDRLLREYRTVGPALPKSARIIRYATSTGTPGEKPTHSLAFCLDPRQEEKVIRIGWRDELARYVHDVEELSPEEVRRSLHLMRGDVVFAIRCLSIGETEVARAVLQGGSTPDERTCMTQLRQTAWNYWERQIDQEGSDWLAIAGRLKRLLAADESFDTRANRELIADLAVSTRRETKPGSVEAMIEDLLEEREYRLSRFPWGTTEKRTPYQRLARLGFRAVPALIEALDDRRLTRAVDYGGDGVVNFDCPRLRIQDLASALLEDVSGSAAKDGLWRRGPVAIAGETVSRNQPEPLTRAEARKWWAKARAIGEEEYVARRAIPRSGSHNNYHLAILAERYPRRLPAVYRRFLKDREEHHQSWTFAEAVASSRLTIEEKGKLLAEGASHKNLLYRRDALRHLCDVDRAAARKKLVETFLSFPLEYGKDLHWPKGDPWEAQFAYLVGGFDDDLVWKAFEQAVRRASPRLRQQMLSALEEGERDEWKQADRSPPAKMMPALERLGLRRTQLSNLTPQHHRVLTFLATLGGRKQMDEDDRLLSISESAVLEMAFWMEMEVPADVQLFPEQWAAFLASVREAWAQERPPDDKPKTK